MAKDVNKMLYKSVEKEGKMDSKAAEAYIKSLKKEKRYQRDIY